MKTFVTTYPRTDKKELQSAVLVNGIPISLEVLLKLSHFVFQGWLPDSTSVLKSQISDLKSQTGRIQRINKYQGFLGKLALFLRETEETR